MVKKIVLLGRLTGDAELSYTQSQMAVAHVSVAVNKRYKDREDTTFFRCTLWGKRAEAVSPYLKKGTQVYVEGDPVMRKWKKKTGEEVESLDVTIEDIQLFGSSNKPQQLAQHPQATEGDGLL